MIRRAKISDVTNIVGLIKTGSQNGKVLFRSQDEIVANIDKFFVYVERQIVVGCCALEVYSQKLAEIRSLVVLPAYQNKGIGSKLIIKCLRAAQRLEIYQVLAVTDHGKLFRRAGFAARLDDKEPLFMNLTDWGHKRGGES
ncbi:MAG: GNAT family N-acetyltransferase [bacterium]|nr:GNAT family N-acetyltransferase [bacterium]